MLRRHFGEEFTHHQLRAVLANFDACSAKDKQTDRFIARLAANMEEVRPASTGEEFGAVDDEEPGDFSDDGSNKVACSSDENGSTMWGFDRHANYLPMEWAVENTVPAVGVGVYFGDGNVGKSFLGLDLLDHVKRGTAWFGRHVLQGGAMYICAEGHAGLDSRLKALYDTRPVNSKFESIAVRGDLPVFGEKPVIAAKKIEEMIQACSKESGQPVRVVVLDNLSLMEGNIDENAGGGMTAIFGALGQVARKLKLVFLIVHHATKDGKSYRGTTAIRNSADFVLKIVEDSATGIRTISADKLRDAPKGDLVHFKLRAVKIGVNRFRNEVTSCIVEPLGADELKIAKGEKTGLKTTRRCGER